MATSVDVRAQIASETQRFNAAIRRYIEMTRANVTRTVLAVTFEALGRVQERTPVDTGRARASWHVVKPGETDSYQYSDKRGNNFDGTLTETTPDPTSGHIVALLGTNVVYMPALEAGHSKQAPGGMVRITLAEMIGYLDERLRAAIPTEVK